MFIDIRDFTPYAETHTAEDTVARLNALFAIVVPAVVEAGGHINKFLGDGALAVFGAPNVAARVEQLTKTTNDPILLTDTCVNALTTPPPGLADRGPHTLKGKSTPITVYGLSDCTSRGHLVEWAPR
jgi:class 3 adenylate cyclase